MSDATDPEPTDETQPSSADLVAMLRDEPIPDDELARERRIRAALAVFDQQVPSSVPRAASGRARRSGSLPWWLTAAAVLVLISGFVVASNRSGNDELASSDSAGDAATQFEQAQSGADAAGAEASPAAGAGSTLDEAAVGELVDLGPQPDRDAVIAAATNALGEVSTDLAGEADTTASPPSTTVAPGSSAPAGQDGAAYAPDQSVARRPSNADELPCVQQLLGSGELPTAVASVDGIAVIVVRRPSGYEVYEVGTCRPSAGR